MRNTLVGGIKIYSWFVFEYISGFSLSHERVRFLQLLYLLSALYARILTVQEKPCTVQLALEKRKNLPLPLDAHRKQMRRSKVLLGQVTF